MGRKKLAMKQIEDKSKRLVTFSKRRSGLIKKANQLSVLCDVDIALLVFSSSGKLYKFSSSPDSLINLVKHYRNQLGEAEELEAVKITEVGGPAIDLLGVNDLMQLEKQLHSALDKVRSKKERDQKEQHGQLNKEIAVLVSNDDRFKGFRRDLNVPIDGDRGEATPHLLQW
ncbi:hypothetical protein CDL15_Pgr009869 [Punica granatum]|uniref:MADS-box domain-containing protein n=1 Tax=Punica granatum TaxID=22663 RepID=A0A218WU75_PUNGR|nr:hypothetical protein CDL15_Pgr009869 [Punica granatum]